MNLSDEGFRLIKSFEGYHRRLPNGDCTTYRCPAHVLTIGYGCTVGISDGMVWTEAQAEEALKREIAKHEAAVTRLVTVDLNQNEYDALVSFSYNCGIGALSKSSLLKKLNANDRLGAAKQFERWTRGGGRVLKGLVARRKREAALFLKPVAAPEDPIMPQEVQKPAPEITPPVAVAGGFALSTMTLPTLPTPPDLSGVAAWRSFAQLGGDLASWFLSNWMLTAASAAIVAFFAFLPQLVERLKWQQS